MGRRGVVPQKVMAVAREADLICRARRAVESALPGHTWGRARVKSCVEALE